MVREIWRSTRQIGVRPGRDECLLFPCRGIAGSIILQAMTCSPSCLAHRLVAHAEIIVRLFLERNKQGNTYHDRTFTPPLLRGLGEIHTASNCGHRATYSRAACLAQHAPILVDWHVRDAYCGQSCLVVPCPDGRG